MAQTTPPGIDPVPTPAIQRGDRATFSNRVDAFILWLVAAVTQFQALATNVYNNAVDAFNSATGAAGSATASNTSAAAANTSAGNASGSATAAAGSATNAANSATNAAGSATNAANSATNAANSATNAASAAAALVATSTTSTTVATGAKTFTTQAGKQFSVGADIKVVDSTNAANALYGTVSSYSGTSLGVNVTTATGSGTVAAWNIAVSGPRGAQGPIGDLSGNLTGVLNEVKGANVASATTINLTATTGNLVHITGTTPITGITLQVGAERTVIFDGVMALTNSAGLVLPGAANITTAVGDSMVVRGDTAGAVVTGYTRASGNAVAPSHYVLLATLTPTVAANLDLLNVFSSAYDQYKIMGQGVGCTSSILQFRLANAGVVDTGTNIAYAFTGSSTQTLTTFGRVTVNNAGPTGVCFEITVQNANDTSARAKRVSAKSVYSSDASPAVYQNSDYENWYQKTAALSGIRFYWDSGQNFNAQGLIRVYGIRNAN